MHTFLDNFHQGGKYSAQIAIHQAELRIEENLLIKNIYLFHPYRHMIQIWTSDQFLDEIVKDQTLFRKSALFVEV